ncbi:hypothetical protein [Methylobacterium sp. J-070]|uniref:hypothetical protein n=1 Tax=Methylobacterium sp. J-070 TaxID=2836650 RepID=UPI001FBAFFE7|nr:hypothetical protein [Methylobacterium sp. J-070]MCJ2052801.1 hypothetical protein [Methylobacterium sp. J-070]
MSASPLNPDDYDFGDPNKLRAYITERMAAVAMRADLINTYAVLGDDVGLRYAMRCAAAEFRAALNLLGDLTEQTERDRRQPAPSPHPRSNSEVRL